jgi:hypothetical protein
LFIVYEEAPFFDVFSKIGVLLRRVNIQRSFVAENVEISKVKFVKAPRLDWSDRMIDMVEQYNKKLIKRVIAVGECTQNKTHKFFLSICDIPSEKVVVTKLINHRGEDEIRCIAYGPYDNGHIIMGMATGFLIVYDAVSLCKIHSLALFGGKPI